MRTMTVTYKSDLDTYCNLCGVYVQRNTEHSCKIFVPPMSIGINQAGEFSEHNKLFIGDASGERMRRNG